MTQIFAKNNLITFSESKYCQNHGQCSEMVERGLIQGWHGENIDHAEEKSSK